MAGFDAFFKSAFTVDNIIFGFDESDLKVLLIKRGIEPYPNTWALPGDFVYPDEALVSAAKRVLKELTGLQDVYFEQVRTFGAVDRHPFGRVITIAYYSLIKIDKYIVTPASFAKKAKWHSIKDVPKLPFDHNEILTACWQRLKSQVKIQPVGFELLPPKFTLTELQHLYEAILEKDFEKRNFRKKMLSMGLLKDLNEMQVGVAHRPARLYSFDEKIYEQLKADGFTFEVKEAKKKESSYFSK